MADQDPIGANELRPGYLVSLAVKTFLLVGVVLVVVCFTMLTGFSYSYQQQSAGGSLGDWSGWILERAFLDGLDPRLSAGELVGAALWTGMRTFGFFPLSLALMARHVSREIWAEPRHHIIRLVGLGMFVLALLNPDDLMRSALPYGLNIEAMTWGPALTVIGGCLDRQLFGAEKPAWQRDWAPASRGLPQSGWPQGGAQYPY
ncbi:hypothetical protein [Propionibacterium australiense]|nr:hypothetical protein [Propionibacterium australiense]RLP09604.1 hypothetical protein D7U36_07345 [Propionibacterium australiense]RLP12306.1 hypothetical protein D9T14_00125 [Propionibacterium australiense]